MSKNIYKDLAFKYLSKGMSVIPDKYAKKGPAIRAWTQYGKTKPTLEEVTGWVTSFKETNIAVMLGEVSGIVALDVDTDDTAMHKIINTVAGPSPVEKKGKKGYTRFYRYTGQPTQIIKDASGNVIVELLSSGKKTTIPPSMHECGKPYEWTDKDLLDIDVDSLPKLAPSAMEMISMKVRMMDDSGITHSNVVPIRQESGRHNALGTQAARMISEQVPVSTAIERLITFDTQNHETPLFTDKTEYQCDISYINALAFYSDYLKSINIKRGRDGLMPELPISSSPIVSQVQDSKTKVLLPSPTGLLRDIQLHILERSFVEQPVFALSAALSLVGTLGSRKFTFQGATPNMFILNIADSGSGKDSCQQVIKDLLYRVEGARHLLGATSYPSEASITVDLPANPVRLDIIDEASSFLQVASNGGSAYQVGIGDTLCELFSCSNSYYLGKSLATRETGGKSGACHRPHLNLLCSTTYKGISESISRSSLEKGLFARFLTFFGENNKPGKRLLGAIEPPKGVLERLEDLFRWINPTFTGNNIQNQPALELKCSKEADELLDQYHRSLDNMRISQGSDSVVRPVIARLYQQMLKLTLISALGNKEIGKAPVVSVDDVKFGYELIMYYYQEIGRFIEDNLYDSYRGLQTNVILRIITDAGLDGITTIDLAKRAKSIPVRERKEIMNDLIQTKQVILETKGSSEGDWILRRAQ